FRRLAHLALALGVGVAVADQLVAALDERVDDLWAVVVERRVHERADADAELGEEVQAAPHPYAVAVVAPRVVEHVGLGVLRPDARAEACAKSEVLEVDADVHREAPALRPGIVGPPRDRGVGVTSV